MRLLCEMRAWACVHYFIETATVECVMRNACMSMDVCVYDFIEATADKLSLWNSCGLLKEPWKWRLHLGAPGREVRHQAFATSPREVRPIHPDESLGGKRGPDPNRYKTCRTWAGLLSYLHVLAGIPYRWVLEGGPPEWHVPPPSRTWGGGKHAPCPCSGVHAVESIVLFVGPSSVAMA